MELGKTVKQTVYDNIDSVWNDVWNDSFELVEYKNIWAQADELTWNRIDELMQFITLIGRLWLRGIR